MIKSQKGQATVELAITLTVLLFLLFGIIDFGRIFHSYLSLEHAGREGARIASVGGTDSEISHRIHEATPTLDSSQINIKITPSIENRRRGVYAEIHLSYPISLSTPLFNQILPNPVVLNAKTVMRVE